MNETMRNIVKGDKALERILGGDGSKESPFEIHTSNPMLSAAIQAEIIDNIYGFGTYDENGLRNYFDSPNGNVGDGDLCEHIVNTPGGEVISVWFDLHMVRKLSEDPKLTKMKQDMARTAASRLTDEKPPIIEDNKPSAVSGLSHPAKDGVSYGKFTEGAEVFIIEATSDVEVCEKINEHLAPFFKDGWIIGGNSHSLIDGWKNQYNLSRNSEKKVCEFDLRPSLPYIQDTMVFTVASMLFGVGEMIPGTQHALDKIEEFKKLREKQLNPPKESFLVEGCLVPIGGFAFLYLIYKLLSSL
jgi:hypothetical protein